MPLRVGRIQVLGIAAILALFFAAEYSFRGGFDAPGSPQQASARR